MIHNKQIRTMPGGRQLLDLLALVSAMRHRLPGHTEEHARLTVIEGRLQGIRDSIVDEILAQNRR